MSAIASFYLMKKDKFNEFCKIAHLVPYERARIPKGILQARAVTQKEMNSPEFKKTAGHYNSLWNFLSKNAKEPFEFNWSGYVILDLMCFLKDKKNIDLMKVTVVEEEGGDFAWQVISIDQKKQFLEALDPKKFTEDELRDDYIKFEKDNERRGMEEMSKKLSKEKFEAIKQMRAKMQAYNEFPERGRAFLEGIKVIHECLKLIDDNSVVMIHIG